MDLPILEAAELCCVHAANHGDRHVVRAAVVLRLDGGAGVTVVLVRDLRIEAELGEIGDRVADFVEVVAKIRGRRQDIVESGER